MSTPSTPRKHSVFAETPLFASLTPSEIESLTQRAVEKRYSAGEILFSEGEACTGLFVLGQGTVKIFKTSGSGREIMLSIDSAPSTVAEVPLFDGGPYPASVRAITDAITYLIRKQDFTAFCRQYPDVALKVLAVVGRRLRHLVGIVESVTFGSVRQRLARSLIEFGQEAGKGTFPLPVTHEELAFRLGTVREVVSRNLGRFQAEGFIKVQKREIAILDRSGLEREAETEM